MRSDQDGPAPAQLLELDVLGHCVSLSLPVIG